MTKQLDIFSASGSNSQPQSSKDTGRKASSGETSPSLLPTPTSSDWKGAARKPRDSVDSLVENGATKNKTGLLSPEAFLASRSVTLDEEKERQMTATSGRTCFKSYEMLHPTGSSLKTCVDSLLGTTAWYSKQCALTWKPKVTKSNRLLFQLSPSVRRIDGIESGLLLTVTANEAPQDLAKFKKRMEKYPNGTTMPNLSTQIGTETGKKLRLQPAMTQWMQGFPTGWTILSDEKEK